MSQNQWATFSGQQLASAFAQEADAFGAIAMRPGFDSLISQYSDYEGYLRILRNDSNQQHIVKSLLSNNGIIETAVPTAELAQLFCQAQIAACCELFKGSNIDGSQMSRDGMRALIEQGTATLINIPQIPVETPPEQYTDTQKLLLNGINIIQNVDTVRIMQLLKLLGVFTISANQTQQLSLGVGNGYRDIYGIHLTPKINPQQDGSRTIYRFETTEGQAAHTVLIDNDPVYRSHFDTLSKEEGGRVLALNTDAEIAIENVQNKQQEGELEQRNLVACLRLDHRMIPDSENFLQSISKVIAPEADLIMTIGAGNNLEEFEGRLKVFDELYSSLSEKGLEPIRMLLHGKGSPAEQRGRPNFGQLAYASYQVLFCKLDRERLQ